MSWRCSSTTASMFFSSLYAGIITDRKINGEDGEGSILFTVWLFAQACPIVSFRQKSEPRNLSKKNILQDARGSVLVIEKTDDCLPQTFGFGRASFFCQSL